MWLLRKLCDFQNNYAIIKKIMRLLKGLYDHEENYAFIK